MVSIAQARTVQRPPPTQPQPVAQPFQQAPPTGLIGSEQALGRGLAGSERALQQGLRGSLDLIGRGLEPFVDPGIGAFQTQAAQSGALGPEAQREAFAAFMASPGQDFLRDQGERALLRNAAAIGGIGGGNVREELTRRGIGFAAQDFGNQFDRLGSLSRIGADLTRSGVLQGSQNIFQTGGALAGGRTRFGENVAGGRTRAGEAIAGQVAGTTSALADLLERQGTGGADIIGAGTGEIADLLTRAGTGEADAKQQLAAILAQLTSGAGGQVAGLPSLPELERDPGILEGLQSAAGSLGTLAALSDIRLKKDIVKIGQTKKGINLYTWNWNEIGQRLTGQLKGIGVIAQEVRKIIPEAVTEQDWLRVDYSKVI